MSENKAPKKKIDLPKLEGETDHGTMPLEYQDRYLISDFKPKQKPRGPVQTRLSQEKQKSKGLKQRTDNIDDPILNHENRQYVGKMRELLQRNMQGTRSASALIGSNDGQTVAAYDGASYQQRSTGSTAANLFEENPYDSEYRAMIERQRQRRRVIEDFKNYYKPLNKQIAKVDPTASIFERVESMLKEKPMLVFGNRNAAGKSQTERQGAEDGLGLPGQGSSSALDNNDSIQIQKISQQKKVDKTRRSASTLNLKNQQGLAQDSIFVTENSSVEGEDIIKKVRTRRNVKPAVSMRQEDNPYQEQFFEDITSDEIRQANQGKSQELFKKLKRKDDFCKLRLNEAIDRSHHNVKKVSQGKTLYSMIEGSVNGMPKIGSGSISQGMSEQQPSGLNLNSQKKMKATEQSSIPIFENGQIMQAVGQYLDLSTLRTQQIKTKEDSEFNQLLRLQNHIKQKKASDISKNVQLDIMKSIKDKYNRSQVRNKGQMLLKNYFQTEMSKNTKSTANTHQVSKQTEISQVGTLPTIFQSQISRNREMSLDRDIVMDTNRSVEKDDYSQNDGGGAFLTSILQTQENTSRSRISLITDKPQSISQSISQSILAPAVQLQQSNNPPVKQDQQLIGGKKKFKMFVRNVENLNFGKNPALFSNSALQPTQRAHQHQNNQGSAANATDTHPQDCHANSLVNLCDYLQKHQLAINLEQKMYFIINDSLKNCQNYQHQLDSILSGYMNQDLHTALINYFLVLKIDKMTKGEVELILSKVFDKNEETRALQSYVRDLKERNQLKCLQPQGLKKQDAEGEAMPNLMKMAGINNPLNHHMNQEELIHLFKVYLKVKEQNVSAQMTAFNNLKNLLFQTEKFDNRIFESDLTNPNDEKDNQQIQRAPSLKRQLTRRSGLMPTKQATKIEKAVLPTLETLDDQQGIAEQLQDFPDEVQELMISKYLHDQQQQLRKQQDDLENNKVTPFNEILQQEPQSHESIMQHITQQAKKQQVQLFEEAINFQYQKTMEQEKDPNFVKIVKERANKNQKSIISKQTREQLLQLDFEPGDEIMIQMYLRQIRIYDQIKRKYNQRLKIHEFIAAFIAMEENNDERIESIKRFAEYSPLFGETIPRLTLQQSKDELKRQQVNQIDILNYNNLKKMKVESDGQRNEKTKSLMQQLDHQLTMKETNKIYSPRATWSIIPTKTFSSATAGFDREVVPSRSQSPKRKQLSMGQQQPTGAPAGTQATADEEEGQPNRIDHMIRYLTTKSSMFTRKDQLSADTLKALERMDLDRQILFREKIDVLLEEKDDKINIEEMKRNIHENGGDDPHEHHHGLQRTLSKQRDLLTDQPKRRMNRINKTLEAKKETRKKVNQHQKDVYNLMLKNIAYRIHSEKDKNTSPDTRVFDTKGPLMKPQKPLPVLVGGIQSDPITETARHSHIGVSQEEIRFLNLIKLVLDAGWCLDAHSYLELSNIAGMTENITKLYDYLKANVEEEVQSEQPDPLKIKRNSLIAKIQKKNRNLPRNRRNKEFIRQYSTQKQRLERGANDTSDDFQYIDSKNIQIDTQINLYSQAVNQQMKEAEGHPDDELDTKRKNQEKSRKSPSSNKLNSYQQKEIAKLNDMCPLLEQYKSRKMKDTMGENEKIKLEQQKNMWALSHFFYNKCNLMNI